jgi:hypothetical protein
MGQPQLVTRVKKMAGDDGVSTRNGKDGRPFRRSVGPRNSADASALPAAKDAPAFGLLLRGFHR